MTYCIKSDVIYLFTAAAETSSIFLLRTYSPHMDIFMPYWDTANLFQKVTSQSEESKQ